MPTVTSTGVPLWLPSFDEDGVTKGRSGTAVTRLNPEGVDSPILQVAVTPRQGRRCDVDGAPFARMAIYIQAWEIVSKAIDIPPGPFNFPVTIQAGTGTSAEINITGIYTVAAKPPPANPFDGPDNAGLVVQFSGLLVDTVYISIANPIVPVPPGFDVRPNFVFIADRQDGIIDGPAGTGAFAIVKGIRFA